MIGNNAARPNRSGGGTMVTLELDAEEPLARYRHSLSGSTAELGARVRAVAELLQQHILPPNDDSFQPDFAAATVTAAVVSPVLLFGGESFKPSMYFNDLFAWIDGTDEETLEQHSLGVMSRLKLQIGERVQWLEDKRRQLQLGQWLEDKRLSTLRDYRSMRLGLPSISTLQATRVAIPAELAWGSTVIAGVSLGILTVCACFGTWREYCCCCCFRCCCRRRAASGRSRRGGATNFNFNAGAGSGAPPNFNFNTGGNRTAPAGGGGGGVFASGRGRRAVGPSRYDRSL